MASEMAVRASRAVRPYMMVLPHGHPELIAEIIDAEFSPALAAKDADIAELRSDRDALSAQVAELKRDAELELPHGKWPVVDERDGYIISACPLCGTKYVVGESEQEEPCNP